MIHAPHLLLLGIGRSPYEALFCCPPRCGLASFNLPRDVIDEVQDEEDLYRVLNGGNAGDDNENPSSPAIDDEVEDISSTDNALVNGTYNSTPSPHTLNGKYSL